MSEDKLKDLEELAGKMKEDFAEKAQQGDEHAAIRAGEMSLLKLGWKKFEIVIIHSCGKLADVSVRNAVSKTPTPFR